MVEFLLIDMDDTILDFHKAEFVALGRTMEHFGVAATQENRELYRVINHDHWHRLELGELTRDQVRLGRFQVFFSRLGRQVDSAECARVFEKYLSTGHFYLPGAEEALQALQGRYRMFLASNGTSSVSRPRIASAGLEKYFENIFISHELGANKPSLEYFEKCFAAIPGFDPSRAMIVGDSLSSDIRGGNVAGIRTCWVNPGGKVCPPDIHVDLQIQSLSQLPGALEGGN